MVNYDNIPEELKKLDQWVCANDRSKVPMKAWENEAASSTNPETWSDFETALESYNQHYYDYCGFVFADNGYVGIDIDEGYDEDGLMSVLGADIVGKCHSYTEKSRSGHGFHILLRGTLPFKGKNNLAGVEIYKAARYFIMTGNTLLYREIIENQEAIDYVVEKYFPEARETSDKVVVGRPLIVVLGYFVVMHDHAIVHIPVFGCKNWAIVFAILFASGVSALRGLRSQKVA